MEKKFGIKVISNSCGILPHTLRVWEQRYQIFNPERSDGGQRLYSEDDLKKAKLLAILTEDGHTISSLARYTLEELEQMTGIIPPERKKTSKLINTKPVFQYVANYNIDKLAAELKHLRMSVGAKDFIFSVVLPIIRDMGLLVAKGKYTVTQEHIISTIIREQLSQIYLPNLGKANREMALATPEGNLHELAIIIADILCRANRITTRYLGAAHPAECLGQALNALKTPYLVLGAISSDQWSYQQNIIPYLKKIDKYLDKDLTVILGGGSDINFPEFQHIKKIITTFTLEEFDRFLEEL